MTRFFLAGVCALSILPTAVTQENPGFKAVIEGKYYVVRANAPEEDARRIASEMDQTHERYLGFFQTTSPHPISVDIYSSRAEYDAVHPDLKGSEAAFSHGFLWWQQKIDAFRDAGLGGTLRHEVAHQFVHHVCTFDVERSSALRRLFRVPDSVERLPSVPVWLNEGIAEYLAASDDPLVNPWKVNRHRLLELQEQLRDGSMDIRKLVAAKYVLGTFPGECYGAAWGVVYFLMNDKDPRKEKRKQELLRTYLATCKDPLLNYTMKEAAEEGAGSWIENWARVVNACGVITFDATIARPFGGIDAFDAAWREWILALDPEDDYGGLRWKYERVVDLPSASDKVSLKDGRILYCNVVARSGRGVLALVNNQQTFFSTDEVAAVDEGREDSSRRYHALVVKEAMLQVSGPGDPAKVVGRKEFKGNATLPGKTLAKDDQTRKQR